MFAVVEFNQASGRPASIAELFDEAAQAAEHRDTLRAQAAAAGRREHYRLFTLEEMDESELVEWGVRHGGHTIPTLDGRTRPTSVTTYVDERAARRNAGSRDVLVRRHAGGQWEEVIDV